jgi:hypothetical protein
MLAAIAHPPHLAGICVDDWLGAGHVDAKGEGCQQRGGGNVDAAARPNVILHDADHPSAVVLPVVRLK